MLYLILSILCSTCIVIVFKLFEKYSIHTFQAIVVNYWVCVITGSLAMGRLPLTPTIHESTWFPFALVLGLLFISGFYTIGKTVQHYGLTISSVMQKMSLLLSVPFAIWVFQEEVTPLKITGLLLALASVILGNLPSKSNQKTAETTEQPSVSPKKWLWLLPLATFLVSGLIEALLQYVQGSLLQKGQEEAIFSTFLFGTAGVLGLVFILIQVVRGQMRFAWKNLLGGIALGIPNYGSIYFLLMAFDWKEKSVILPINNVGVIVTSALLALLLFRERLSLLNWLGAGLAILAILLIML